MLRLELILLHNLCVLLMPVFCSVILKRVFVVLVVIYNIAVSCLVFLNGVSNALHEVVYALLPHGIPEYLALTVAAYVGWQVAKCDDITCFKQALRKYCRLIVIAVILLTTAAYIETYVTPELIKQHLERTCTIMSTMRA